MNNPTVYSEESHGGVSSESHLYGVEACQMDDVVYLNCLIELVNSQVVLCGTETPGYVIVSASNTTEYSCAGLEEQNSSFKNNLDWFFEEYAILCNS